MADVSRPAQAGGAREDHAGESVLNVCGSFGCRTIEADLSVAAERIAEK